MHGTLQRTACAKPQRMRSVAGSPRKCVGDFRVHRVRRDGDGSARRRSRIWATNAVANADRRRQFGTRGLALRDDLPAAWRPNGVTPPVLPQGLTSQCGPQPATPYDPTNLQWQQWIDCARRYSASQLTSVTFDDDLNPADGDQQQFGAGPVAEVTDTIGNPALEAGGIISTPSPPVYKPVLQANLGNTAEGDLVSGTYGWNQAYDDAAAVMDESQDYSRRDFVPDTAKGTITDTGFLARLRRSPENFGSALGVASNGPPIPFLFGRGSMIPRIPGENGQLSVQSGITIRATAIAGAGTISLNPTGGATTTTVVGHVLTVGPVDTVDGIRGLAPFGVTLTYWQSLNNPANGAQGADTRDRQPDDWPHHFQSASAAGSDPKSQYGRSRSHGRQLGPAGHNRASYCRRRQRRAAQCCACPVHLRADLQHDWHDHTDDCRVRFCHLELRPGPAFDQGSLERAAERATRSNRRRKRIRIVADSDAAANLAGGRGRYPTSF